MCANVLDVSYQLTPCSLFLVAEEFLPCGFSVYSTSWEHFPVLGTNIRTDSLLRSCLMANEMSQINR